MSDSFEDLTLAQVCAIFSALERLGFTSNHLLALSDPNMDWGGLREMLPLVVSMNPPNFVFYTREMVCNAFGLHSQRSLVPEADVPTPERNRMIWYYGGWSLLELCDSLAGIRGQLLGEVCGLSAVPGYYTAPFPKSGAPWIPGQDLPVPVIATLLAIHLRRTGVDLLGGQTVFSPTPPSLNLGSFQVYSSKKMVMVKI